MKVLIQGKVDLLTSGGGDRIQIENTARELRKLGVEVDIIPGFKVDYTQYDVVHLFQLDWTPETYLYARSAKAAGKPVVLSPIHHSLTELKKFDDVYTFDFRRIAKFLFRDQYKRDTFKNIYKSLFDLKKAKPTLTSMFIGLKNMQKMALEFADVVLVQTELEAHDLTNTYGVDIKWFVVPNGVGAQFLEFTNSSQSAGLKSPTGLHDYIVCVGRIEARKNQLSVIDAVELVRKKHNIDVPLVLVGRRSKLKHAEYIYRFERRISKLSWLKFLEEVPYEDMPAIYHFAKVCVSASWFETTGLTSLEALFCGTNAVAAGSRAQEYLGDNASYCEPDDIHSIATAIAKEYFAPRPDISGSVLQEYTWENAAKKTLEIYNFLT